MLLRLMSHRLVAIHTRNGAQDLELYLEVTKRVHDAAKSTFNCTSLWLTSPTFFSRMDGKSTSFRVCSFCVRWDAHG